MTTNANEMTPLTLERIAELERDGWGPMTFEEWDELLELAKRALKRPQTQWQDIASAPTNISVLIFIPNWDHYGPGIYRAILVDMGGSKHWTTTAWSCGRDLRPDVQPTHWQPLPAPPEVTDGR
jgi:hypothetical protein